MELIENVNSVFVIYGNIRHAVLVIRSVNHIRRECHTVQHMTFLHNHAEAVIVIDFSVTVDVNINVLGILCELVKSPFAFFYYGIYIGVGVMVVPHCRIHEHCVNVS